MRSVGGADLCQPAASARHDVGHAERTADLDQLAARDNDFAAFSERVQDQQHRRGVVVDQTRILGTGQTPQQTADMVVALAPLAPLEIEFKRGGCAHRCLHRGQRRFG
jgi:hypothetical protein